jgi:hypothetical protein
MRIATRWRGLFLSITALLCLFSLAPAAASSANISHSYQAQGDITNGSLVSQVSGQSQEVEAANTENGQRLLGVAVDRQDSLLAVDPDGGSVQVATDGTVNTLVSDVNGDIKAGDQVAVSPFNGIGMKASPGSRIIGLAQTGFTSKNSNSQTQTVTDKQGRNHNISVGLVRLSLAIGTASQDSSLSGLQHLAVDLTGHKVSVVRLILSLVIAITALTVLVTLTYGAIYGSIISIGRNPLAKFAVYRTLRSVVGMVVLTAVVAAILIFFLLR